MTKQYSADLSNKKTIKELKGNIIDAYRMMLQEYDVEDKHTGTKNIELGVEV